MPNTISFGSIPAPFKALFRYLSKTRGMELYEHTVNFPKGVKVGNVLLTPTMVRKLQQIVEEARQVPSPTQDAIHPPQEERATVLTVPDTLNTRRGGRPPKNKTPA